MHCVSAGSDACSGVMKRIPIAGTTALLVLLPLLPLAEQAARADQPTAIAVVGFDAYVHALELRLGRQHGSPSAFLAPADQDRLRHSDLVIERVAPEQPLDLPGAMLHHWRGTTFVPGAHAADFERVMRDYAGYPKYFSPQVLSAHVLRHDGDRYRVAMRVEQKHVLAVVLDTDYDVTFGRLDSQHGYSISHSTQISEIASAGTPQEHALSPAEDHGFLWRLDTYWSYEERDGGLYLQIETVSLTRAIPPGLGWAVGPFVESVPKESLEFTLRSVCDALGTRRSEGTGVATGVQRRH